MLATYIWLNLYYYSRAYDLLTHIWQQKFFNLNFYTSTRPVPVILIPICGYELASFMVIYSWKQKFIKNLREVLYNLEASKFERLWLITLYIRVFVALKSETLYRDLSSFRKIQYSSGNQKFGSYWRLWFRDKFCISNLCHFEIIINIYFSENA